MLIKALVDTLPLRIDTAREKALIDRYLAARQFGVEDTEARSKLVEMNLRKIRSLAKKIHLANQQHTELDELVSVGCLGFIDGLRRFDAEHGVRVSTYCLWYSRGAIHTHVREVRFQSAVGEADYKLIMKMNRVLAKKPVRFDGHIDFTPLAKELEITERECHQLYATSKSVRSLETPTSRNGKQKLGDKLRHGKDNRGSEASKAFEIAAHKLMAAIEELPAPERKAIKAWYFDRAILGYLEYATVSPMDSDDGYWSTTDEGKLRTSAKKMLKKMDGVKEALAIMNSFEEKPEKFGV
jgi:RNA polymerase sigma factor (sigma-70 family)